LVNAVIQSMKHEDAWHHVSPSFRARSLARSHVPESARSRANAFVVVGVVARRQAAQLRIDELVALFDVAQAKNDATSFRLTPYSLRVVNRVSRHLLSWSEQA